MVCMLCLVSTLMAGPIITFEGTFTDSKKGLMSGMKDVTVTLASNADITANNPGKVVWAETIRNVLFTNGYMSIELGRVSELKPDYFSLGNLSFLVKVEGVDGRISMPLRYVPFSIQSETALRSYKVPATGIEGTIPTDKLSGVYPGITGFGEITGNIVTNGSLNVKGVLFADKTNKRVGIGTASPSHTLTVDGSIRLLKGEVVFPDGTTLNSTEKLTTNGGGPVVSTGSVILEADTDKDEIGDFELKLGGVKRFVVRTKNKRGYAGFDVENPRQALEINGGLLIGDTNTNVTGSIRFHDNKFEGYNGKSWRQLDTLTLQGGGWTYDPRKDASFSNTTTKFGIGTQQPRGKLDVIGDIYSEKLISKEISGIGKDITQIQAKNIEGLLSIDQGGTGKKLSLPNRLLAVNSSGNMIQELSALDNGQLLIGVKGKVPVAGNIVASGAMNVWATTGSIMIAHKDTSTQNSVINTAETVIQSIGLDEFGHIQTIQSKDIKDMTFTKDQLDARFIKKSGDKTSGKLEIGDSIEFEGTGFQIQTKANGALRIEKGVKVGIGVLTPKQALDIEGAIRIGNTTENALGTIRYNTGSNRFEGRNNNGWVGLDVNQFTAGGWTLASSGLHVYNASYNVGIGVYDPKEQLHVKGSTLIEESLRVSKDIRLDGKIGLGSHEIGSGSLKGDWDLSNATLKGLSGFEVSAVTINNLLVKQKVDVGGELKIKDKLTIGSVSITSGNIFGNISLNNGQLNNLSQLQVGDLRIKGQTIDGTTNTVNIKPKIVVNDSVLIEDKGITGIKEANLQIRSKQSVDIEGILAKSGALTQINQLGVSGSMTVTGDSLFNGQIKVNKGIQGLTVGIGREAKSNEALGVKGDVVIGELSSTQYTGTDKSDLVVEGNLIVKGAFTQDNNDMKNIKVTGKGVFQEQVMIGATSSGSQAKLIVVGKGSTNSSAAAEWYNKSAKLLAKIRDDGNVGIGVEAPAAKLHIAAGTAEVPAMLIDSGPLLSTKKRGAFEFDGNVLYVTNKNSVRSQLIDNITTQTMENKTLKAAKINGATVESTLLFKGVDKDITTEGTEDLSIIVGGQVGIGIENPDVKLEVDGGIKIGNVPLEKKKAGTLKFNGSRFQGYNGISWINLDYENQDSAWKDTIQHKKTTTTYKVGIGLDFPLAELHVKGRVSADVIIGDGSQIRKIDPHNVSGNIPVSKGGTGTDRFRFASVLLGNEQGKILDVPLFGNGKLLIGDGANKPVAANLAEGDGIGILNGPGSIKIIHKDTSAIPSGIDMTTKQTIKNIRFDTFGHVQSIEKRDLGVTFFDKIESDARFLKLAGGTLTGPLKFAGTGQSIEGTATAKSIIIMPFGDGKVAIGKTAPAAMLDVSGSIKVAKGGTGVAGEIQYNPGTSRFEGYNGSIWVPLDLSKNSDGSFTATSFNGSGTNLTNLNPYNFKEAVPVVKGGTGADRLTQGSILVGNNRNPVQMLPVLKRGEILIGDGDGAPAINTLTQGGGMIIDNLTTAGKITIAHGETSRQLNGQDIITGMTEIIATLNIDKYGHITGFKKRNLTGADGLFYSKTDSDYRFLNLEGGTLRGKLSFNNVTPWDISDPGRDVTIEVGASKGVGIGVAVPLAKLDVAGGIKVGTQADDAAEGTIRFNATSKQFEGKVGTAWKKMDLTQTVTGLFTADKINTTDGSGIKKLNPANIEGIVSVQKGGTGRGSFTTGAILRGAGTSTLSELQLTAVNGIIMRHKDRNEAIAGEVKAGNSGVVVGRENVALTISHANTSDQGTWSDAADKVISKVELDSFGHITKIEEKSLTGGTTPLIHSRIAADNKFVDVAGDTMTGPLFLDRIQTTSTSPNLVIRPATNGKVGIALASGKQPEETLDVNGAIKIADTSVMKAGAIKYSGGKFYGSNGSSWLDLGVQLSDGGMSSDGSTTTLKQTVVIQPPANPDGTPSNKPAIETTGTIKASKFEGDGSQLTNLNPSNLSSVVPLNKGGAGADLSASTIAVGSGMFLATGKLQGLKLGRGELYIGNATGLPAAAKLTAGSGVNINTSDGSITIALNSVGGSNVSSFGTPTLRNSPQISAANSAFIISALNVNAQGQITKLSTTPFSNIGYTTVQSNSTFLKKNQDDTMSQTLTFDQPGSEDAANYDINTGGTGTSKENLTINTNKLGIGQVSPVEKLDVAGAIKIAASSSGTSVQNGTIEYRSDGGFYGRTLDSGASKWRRLDVELGVVEWVGSSAKAYVKNTSQFIGIGNNDPASKLHVTNGNIEVTNGSFKGDGSQITNINPLNLKTVVPLSKGGTGANNLPVNSLIMRGSQNNLEGMTVVNQAFPVGQGTSWTKGKIVVGNSLEGAWTYQDTTGLYHYTINHSALPFGTNPGGNSKMYPETRQNYEVIDQIGLTPEGHVFSVTKKSLSSVFITSDDANKRYLNQTGDNMTGSIEFGGTPLNESDLRSSSSFAGLITKVLHSNLHIVPKGRGKVAIGEASGFDLNAASSYVYGSTAQPKTKLHVRSLGKNTTNYFAQGTNWKHWEGDIRIESAEPGMQWETTGDHSYRMYATGDYFKLARGVKAQDSWTDEILIVNGKTKRLGINRNPDKALDVQASTTELPLARFSARDDVSLEINSTGTGSGTQTTALEISPFNDVKSWKIGTKGNSKLSIGYDTANQMSDRKVTIETDGDVGIGLDSPTSKLHLRAGASITSFLKIDRGTATKFELTSQASGSNERVDFKVSDADIMSMLSSKRVGINTKTPISQFQVKQAADNAYANNGIVLENAAGNKKWSLAYHSTGTGFHIVEDMNSPRMSVQNGGEVGIGTVNPQSLLHVAGNMQVDGTTLYKKGHYILGLKAANADENLVIRNAENYIGGTFMTSVDNFRQGLANNYAMKFATNGTSSTTRKFKMGWVQGNASDTYIGGKFFMIDENGYIGLNVDPTKEFDVNGDVLLRKTLVVEDTTQLKKAATLDQNLTVKGATDLQNTLDVTGVTTLKGATRVKNTLLVTGNTTIHNADSTSLLTIDKLRTTKAAQFDETVLIKGDTTMDENLLIRKTLSVIGQSYLKNHVTITGNLVVQGTTNLQKAVDIDATLNVDGNSVLRGTLNVQKAVDLDTTLNVDGNSVLKGTLNVQKAVDLDTTLNVDGNTTLKGTLTVDKDTNLKEDLVVQKTMNVKQAVDFDTTLNVDGKSTLNQVHIKKGAYFTATTVSGSGSVNLTQANKVNWNSANGTLTFSTHPTGPTNILVRVQAAGSGSRSFAATGKSIKWPGGNAPIIENSSHAIVSFYYDGSTYYALGSLKFQ